LAGNPLPSIPDDDAQNAGELERLADAAAEVDLATAYYRQAQSLLIPPGAVWTDSALYDQRMEAFERIQQKLYELAGQGRLRRGAIPAPHISVWDFKPGLVIRIAQTFKDYDGQEILEGEVLHFLESSYFFYDGGHTLHFQEKTIRLAGTTDEPIIANDGNAWFQPLPTSA